MAVQGDRYATGVADVQTFYDAWIVDDPQFTQLCVRNLDFRAFSAPWDSKSLPTAVWLLSWGRLVGNEPTKRPREGTALALAMAELLGPQLPTRLSLGMVPAREKFASAVWNIITHNLIHTLTVTDHIAFVEWFNNQTANNQQRIREAFGQNVQGQAQQAQGVGGVGLPVLAGRGRGGVAGLGGAGGGAGAGALGAVGAGAVPMVPNPFVLERAEMTFDIAYYVLMFMASRATKTSMMTGVDLLSNIYAAVMKRGNLSEKFKDKVEQGVRDDLNVATTVDIAACRIFYSQYGQYVDATNVADVVAHWTDRMPLRALRLRLIVQQAANSGLTSLIIIGTAMKLHPGFRWDVIERIMPTEVANYQAAVTVVGGNVYYGFNQDLGPVKSTKYKNLSYPAKELLIKLNGHGSLAQYAGWPRVVPHLAVVDGLIADYERVQAARIQNLADEELGPLENRMTTPSLATIAATITANTALYTI